MRRRRGGRMLNTITGFYNGHALIRTKSIPEEKEQSAIDRAREAVERQRKGEKAPKVNKSRKHLAEVAKVGITVCDEILDKRASSKPNCAKCVHGQVFYLNRRECQLKSINQKCKFEPKKKSEAK